LDEKCIVAAVLRGGKPLNDTAQGPAASIVFKPHQAFHQLAILERVIDSREAIETAGQRPLAGQVDLLG
jgi:hypothetical protein